MRVFSDIAADLRALDVSGRSVRSFGRVVGGLLLVLGVIALWDRHWQFTTTGIPGLLFGLGGGLVVLSLFAPHILRPAYRAWMGIAFFLGYVMTRVLLAVLYVVAVTPVGWVRRTFGASPVLTRPDPDAASYWIARAPAEKDPKARLERRY